MTHRIRQPLTTCTEVDLTRPSAARVYDCYLGGSTNFAIDRELARRTMRWVPAGVFARMNRGFLRRAVLHLAEAGIRQFLDLGSGIPTMGNVHEVAHSVAPDARIVYVDNEPVAVAHSTLILENEPRVGVVQADLRDPESVLTHPNTAGLLDFRQPVAVLMFAVLHFVSDDDDPAGIVAAYRDALCSGSYLALSHGTDDDHPDELQHVVELYKHSQNPAYLRGHDEISALFAGVDLIEPGLVLTPLWRPEPDSSPDVMEDPRRSLCYAGVARKH
jgi:hypothetical protein